MTSCPEALRILEFEKKKTVSWDLNSERVSWDSSREEGSRFLVSPRRDQLGSTKCAACLMKKIVSLSPHVENPQTQKSNKKFRIWTNFVFFGFVCLRRFVNVFNVRMNMSISRVHILVVYFWAWICYSRCWDFLQNGEKGFLRTGSAHSEMLMKFVKK